MVPDLMLGIAIVGASVALALGGVCVMRRCVHFSVLREDHDVAGFLYSAVGVVYGVLLGFITVVAWDEYRDTQGYVQQEAVRVSNLVRDAGVFPDAERIALRTALLAYARRVVHDEWPAMARRERSAPASAAYENIWQTVYVIEPGTEREKAFYGEAVMRLNELGAIRRERLSGSEMLVPPLMWALLCGGAVVCIGFTFMFGARSAWSHLVSAGALAGLIGFSLFLISALSSPFSGSLAIQPEPMQRVIDTWAPRLPSHDGAAAR